MMKGPLLMGTVLSDLSTEQIALLQNKHLLAFNQDPMIGEPATPYKWGVNPDWTFNSTFPAMYWSGSSSNGTMVAMLNPFHEEKTMTAVFAEIPQLEAGACYEVLDVWSGQSLGCVEESVEITLAANDTAVYLFGEQCG